MDRKDFFRNGLRDLWREASGTPVGQIVDRQLAGLANLLDPRGLGSIQRARQTDMKSAADRSVLPGHSEPFLSRPPGALTDPDKFSSACTRCGDCIVACPFGTLFSIGVDSGPLLDPNRTACHLCDGFPCISACETGALVPMAEFSLPGFGRAELRAEQCLNSKPRSGSGKRKNPCRKCVEACPVPGALALDGANLPAFADACTGCGICREECPAEFDTIRIA